MSDETYQVSKARIILGKILNKNHYEYTKQVNGLSEDLVLELTDIEKGNYLIYVEVDWTNADTISSFVLSTFSDQHISLEAADKNEF